MNKIDPIMNSAHNNGDAADSCAAAETGVTITTAVAEGVGKEIVAVGEGNVVGVGVVI